jgi:hypothetical protein
MDRPVPDFLIIGAAKSGTTSLIADLRKHPDVFTPGNEVHYFSHFFGNGREWYESHFQQSEKVQGEKSTSYLYELSSHERIYRHNRGMKLIVLLRDPVRRAYSNWTMRYNQSRLLKQAHGFNRINEEKIDNIGFTQLFNHYLTCIGDPVRRMEPLDIFERGRYVEQLGHLLEFFPKEQLLILISEHYFDQPATSLALVSDFLQIRPFPSDQHTWRRKTMYQKEADPRAMEELRRFYKPYNEQLFRMLGSPIEEWN